MERSSLNSCSVIAPLAVGNSETTGAPMTAYQPTGPRKAQSFVFSPRQQSVRRRPPLGRQLQKSPSCFQATRPPRPYSSDGCGALCALDFPNGPQCSGSRRPSPLYGRHYKCVCVGGLCATAHMSQVSATRSSTLGATARPTTTSRRQCLGTMAHETVRFPTNHAIAFAYSRFETSTVENGNTAAMITNQPRVLQTRGLLRDGLATHTQHVGDEFLRHDEFVRRQAIVA